MTATIRTDRAARRPRLFADGASALESMALGVAAILLAVGLAIGAGDALAQRALQQAADADLRALVVEVGYEAEVCPNGWAAAHAPIVGMTEAEVTAWYLREAIERTDREVVRDVALWLRAPADYRRVEGPALTRTQILLCVAASRRMI